VGSRQIVLIDEVNESTAIARSTADAPEIDGVVHMDVAGYDIAAGDFIEVSITGANEHDLFAEVPEDN
jgi:ribosomal protein S12 methylthiotransferase